MNQNIGLTDRLLRVVVGSVLIAGTVFGWFGVWGLLGVVPIFTALLGTCPLYGMLGTSTRRSKRPSAPSSR